MPSGLESSNEIKDDDPCTSPELGTHGVHLGSAAGMFSYNHTDGCSGKTSAAVTPGIRVLPAKDRVVSPLLSSVAFEQGLHAALVPNTEEERRVRTFAGSPAITTAARASTAEAPLHHRIHGTMFVRSDNEVYVSPTRVPTSKTPVCNPRYYRIGKVPIVKLGDHRDSRLPPYASMRPGTMRIAPPDDVPLSAILTASEVTSVSNNLLPADKTGHTKTAKKEPTDTVLEALIPKSRKRYLLNNQRIGASAIDQSNDYSHVDGASDRGRESKRRRLENEGEEEEVHVEADEMADASACSPSGMKQTSGAAYPADGGNRAGDVRPARATNRAGLVSASQRNAIASSYSALLPAMLPKSKIRTRAVIPIEENSEDGVSRNGSTILVTSLLGDATQRSGTPASAAGVTSNSSRSSRSLVGDAAAADGSLEQNAARRTPPSAGAMSLRRRHADMFHHLADSFKKTSKTTFTPSLEDYAIDELADRERLSKLVGGTFVVAPAVSVAVAAVAAGTPRSSSLTASVLSTVPAAGTLAALGDRTADSKAKPSASSEGTQQPGVVSSVSTPQPPPPTYASAVASSGGIAAATAAQIVPTSCATSSATVLPGQAAVTDSDKRPAEPPVLFGSAVTSLGGQAVVTQASAAVAIADSATPLQSVGKLLPPVGSETAASSVATLPPFVASSLKPSAPTTTGSSSNLVGEAPAGGAAATSEPGAAASAAFQAAAFSSGTSSLFGSVSKAKPTSPVSAAATATSSSATASPAAAMAATASQPTFASGSTSLLGSTFSAKPSTYGAVDGAQKQPTIGSAGKDPTSAATLPAPAPSAPVTFNFGSRLVASAADASAAAGSAAVSAAPTFSFGSGSFGAAKDKDAAVPSTTAAKAPAIVPTFAFGSGAFGAANDKDAASSSVTAAKAPATAPTFTFGSGTFGAAKDKNAAAAEPTFIFGSASSGAAKDKEAPAAAAAAGTSATATATPTFTFGTGLFGAAKDKDTAAPSATAAAAAAMPTLIFGNAPSGAAKNNDVAAGSAAAAAAPAFAFGSGALGAAKDAAPSVPTFIFGGGSVDSCKDKDTSAVSVAASSPGLTFAFGGGKPFGTTKDASVAAGTFGTGSVFSGVSAAAAQPPPFGSTTAGASSLSNGAFSGSALGVSTTVGATPAVSAPGSVRLLFGGTSSSATTAAVATTTAVASVLTTAAATAASVAPAPLSIFGGAVTLPPASSAAAMGPNSSTFGSSFGAGQVAAAGSGALQPLPPFAFGQSNGFSGLASSSSSSSSSFGLAPKFGVGLPQQAPPPPTVALAGASQQQTATPLSGAAQPNSQQQQPFFFGSTSAPSAPSASSLFAGSAPSTAAGAPPAAFSLGGTPQPPAKSSGFNFGIVTSPNSTFVFGAQASSAAAGTATPAATPFGVSPAPFSATPLSSLPTADQGSFTNIFTAGNANSSSVRQRLAPRRTGVAARVGRR